MKPATRWLLLLPLGAFALSLAVSAWSLGAHFEGALTHEFCNYAEIGRNLAQGRGMRTGMVYPFTLALLDERGVDFNGLAPVLDRFPLHATLAGWAQRLAGAQDGAVAGLSAGLLAALAAGTALAGLTLFGPAEAALAAGFIAVNPSFQRAFVLWGQPDFGFATILLALTVLLATMESRGPLGPAIAGGLAAMAWMQRSNLLLWLPLFAWWIARGKGGWRRLALFVAAGGACAAPAALYYWSWYGSLTPPTLSWNLAHHVVVDTPPWLHYRVFSPWETLTRHGAALARKVAHYLVLQLVTLPFWWQLTFASPLAALGAWWIGRSPNGSSESGTSSAYASVGHSLVQARRRWAALIGLMLGLQLVAFSFLRFELLGPWVGGRYYIWAAPALLLLAAHAAVEAGRRLGRPWLVPAAFAGLNAVFFLGGLWAPQGPPAYPGGRYAADWPELGAVTRLSAPDSLVATNLPGQVAWYAGRSAVALPADPEDLLRIDERHPVDTLLLSRLQLGELENTPAWKPLLDDLKQLEAFAKRGHWVPIKDYGSSVLLVRARAAMLEKRAPPKKKARERT